MPAAADKSAVLGGACIRVYSHGANYWSSENIRNPLNESESGQTYHANMPRKSSQSQGVRPEQMDWHLVEWMQTLKVSQAKLAKDCDWTPSTMHGIYHGRTSYYREIVNLLAAKLNIEPFELLMPPDRAMALRRLQEAAITIAHDADARADEVPARGVQRASV